MSMFGPRMTEMAPINLLPRQLQRNLQLTWIERRRGCPRLRVQRVDIGNIKSIQDVEHVQNSVECDAVAEMQAPADAKIGKDGFRPGSGIAAEISGHRAIDEAGRLKEAGRRIFRCYRCIAAGVRAGSGRYDIGPVGV